MNPTLSLLSRIGLSVLVLAFVGASAPGPMTRIIALESTRSLGGGDLADYLASPDEAIAARAALAIGRTKQASGEALLAGHLGDKRDAVRALSVYGIGLLATGRNAGSLIAALSDRSGAVRVAALDAISRYELAKVLGSQQALAQASIVKALQSDVDPIVRARAANALDAFNKESSAWTSAQALRRAIAVDNDQTVRWHAMWTIYRAYSADVPSDFLAKMSVDRNETVRIEAARTIGRRKQATELTIVEPLRNDPSWRVQEQAAEAIRQIEGKPPTDHWRAIPSYIHLPKIAPDPFAGLAALPRTPAHGKLAMPSAEVATTDLVLDPKTAADMTQPVPGAHPRVRIVTTKGNVYLTLYPEWAPITTANFLALTNRGYYDGNRWFRIVPDFVVQTGDRDDNGNGDPHYTIPAEESPLDQPSGIISMGLNYDPKKNTPIRDSANTQYYITLSPQLHLDRDFSVFGVVTSGFDVLAHLIESDRVTRIERIPDVMVGDTPVQ